MAVVVKNENVISELKYYLQGAHDNVYYLAGSITMMHDIHEMLQRRGLDFNFRVFFGKDVMKYMFVFDSENEMKTMFDDQLKKTQNLSGMSASIQILFVFGKEKIEKAKVGETHQVVSFYVKGKEKL